MTRVLALGGNGFLGKSLSKYVLSSSINPHDLISLDKSHLDLSLDTSVQSLKDIITAISPQVVLILACIKRQSSDSKDIYLLNNSIVRTVSQALQGSSCHVIYISSCAVFGEKNDQPLIDESAIFNPTSFYGQHKADSEALLSESIKPDNLVIIRPPLIYNMSDTSSYNPGLFAQQALLNQQIELWGDGTELREFVHSYDFSKIISKLCSLTSVSGIFNLVSGTSHSFRQLANKISEYSNASILEKTRSGPLVNHSYQKSALHSILSDLSFVSPLTAIDHYFYPVEI